MDWQQLVFGSRGLGPRELQGAAVCFPADVLRAPLRKELSLGVLWNWTGRVYN